MIRLDLSVSFLFDCNTSTIAPSKMFHYFVNIPRTSNRKLFSIKQNGKFQKVTTGATTTSY